MRIRTLFLALGLVVGAEPALAQDTARPGIEWSVVNRFRLFDTPAATGVEDGGLSAPDRLLGALAEADHNAPHPVASDGSVDQRASRAAYLLISKFLQTPLDATGRLPYQATHWRGAGPSAVGAPPSADRRYDADYLYPERYQIRARLGVPLDGDCAWRVGDTDLGVVRCRSTIRFDVPARPDGGSDAAKLTVRPLDGSSSVMEETIAVTDRFILGLGESYAAGEGNPDAPQTYGPGFDDAVAAFWRSSPDPNDRWWRDPGVLAHLTPARWWDPLCHRSLYSPQMAAALRYAANRPHEAVTFAAFSCSGTEMLDGILSPQMHPPGESDFGPPSRGYQMTPQIQAALELMCRNALAPTAPRADLQTLGRQVRLDKKTLETVVRYSTAIEARCAHERPVRSVDLVLLSVGGNDVGFAGAVKYELFPAQAPDPVGQIALQKTREVLGVTPPWLANRRILYDLPILYPALRQALRAGLAPGQTPIIQSAYPNPLHDQDTGFCDGPNDNQLFSAMHGMLPDDREVPTRRWRFAITADEGLEVQDALWRPLNEAVQRNADGQAWRYVDFGTSFDRRGWCAGSWEERREFQFPGWRADGNRVSFDPRQWDPYKPRTRLFRTANDVVLTQVGSSTTFPWPVRNFGNRSFFSTAGMFHPAAEANTIIGLAVSEEILRTLPEDP